MLSRRVRRWLIAAAIVVFLIGAYAVFGFFGVPRLLRSNLQSFVSTHYNRQLSVGDIRFNPFALTLEVRALSLPDEDGKPMLGFDRLFVNVGTVSIWRRGPSFQEITLENPFTRVLIHKDGTLNLADLGKGFPPEPAKKPASSGPARLFIDRLSVRGGRTVFEDQSRPEPFSAELQPISFELRDFSTTGKTGNTYALAGASELGERFNWNGTLEVSPVSSRGHFEVDNLQAHTLWSYAQDSLGFEIPSGAIALAGDYDFTASGNPVGLNIGVHDFTVSKLGLRARGRDSNYVNLPKVEVHDAKFDLAKRSVVIGKVLVAGGDVTAWQDADGHINLMEMAARPHSASSAAHAGTGAATSGTPSASGAAGSGTTAPGVSASGGSTSGASASGSAWTVAVPDISIQGFKVSAEDRQTKPAAALHLDPINIHVAGFTTAPNAELQIDADTGINSNAKLHVAGKVSPDSGAVSAKVDLKGLDLTMVQPYLTQRTSMTLLSGQLGTTLNIERGANGSLSVTGDTEVTKLRTVDNALQKDFIKWDLVHASGIAYQSQPAKLRIDRVDTRGAYARVIIQPNQVTNITEVLTPAGQKPPVPQAAAAGGPLSSSATATAVPVSANSGGATAQAIPIANAGSTAASTASGANARGPGSAAASDAATDAATSPAGAAADKSKAPASASSPPKKTPRPRHGHRRTHGKSNSPTDATPSAEGTMAMSIGTVQITNGSAHFADYWIQPNYAVAIQSLNGSVVGLSSDPQSHATLKLEGKIDRYAPVHIDGEINLFAATSYSDIKMGFKGVDMSSVTPYSGHFAGYKIDKGKVSADLSYHVENRKLTADHKIVIDQLQLGDKVDSPEAVKLPLKLAVALLKDRNGVIDLGLPVTGSLDDPQFRLAPIIWKAVLNLIEKAATAPFAMLGRLFGGSEKMNEVDFKPGNAALDDQGRERMASLQKAMKERPQLQLDVPMASSPDLDRPALAQRELQKKLIALKQKELGAQKKGSPAPVDGSVLADPAEHYQLLVAEYRQELGKDTALPDSALAVESAKKKKGEQPAFDPAITDLQNALLAKVQIDASDFEELGKRRARAVQEALLGSGEIDQSRVFLVNAPAKSGAGDVVRAELALK
jgi:hypothetical protein